MMVVAGIRPLAVFIVLLCSLLPLLGAVPALAPVAKEMQAPSLPLHGECMRPTANSIADWLYRDHKNYRAISQALYPSEGDHSLIVWIDIQWWNATEQPGVWDEWAWSTSCLYVVLPLDLFPLLSIWVFNPQQRMQEVTVSLPPFCENVTAEQANSALYLSIKRMEAYVRNRDDPDPNMSMAQCVVAFDQNGNVTPDSDEIGMGKAYFLFYLNLGGIGLLMLALVFLAIQYIVDWINVDRHEAADGDTGYEDVGGRGGGGGGGHDKDHQHRFGIASLDGRGRPSAAEPPDYGSAGHLYVNDLGNVVRVDSDADADVDTDESEAEEAGPGTGEGGEAPRSIYAAVTPDLYTRAVGYETGSAAAAARRNSRHRLHEGEVAQIKGQLQRSRARIMRLRSELGSAEEDLSLGSAAASMRAAGRIRTVRGEARMIEQEIHLCESEAAMVEAAGACSLLKAKEMKYDFLMVKRELLDLRKRLWEVEKAARTAEDELQRRTQSSAVWETYLKALVGSPLLCDLLCAGFLVFLIDFYISMLGPFAKPAVVPLFVVNLLCFVPWAIDFVHHRLGSLLFLFCCSCFLLCERRRTGRHDPIVPPEEGEEGEAAAAKRRSANVWVLLPVVIVFALHFAFFLQWIALATMFDFAYSLEIICILAVMLFHLFMGVKIVLKVVRHIKEDEAEVEARRKTRERTREETGYETMFGGDHKAEYAAAHAINEEEEEEYRRQGLARAFGWCPGPVRACLGSWVWFLLMMLSLLAALVVFLVWLHAGYHTFARQHTAGLQFLLTIITLLVLVLERQIINLDMSRRGAVRSFPRLVRRLLAGGHR